MRDRFDMVDDCAVPTGMLWRQARPVDAHAGRC